MKATKDFALEVEASEQASFGRSQREQKTIEGPEHRILTTTPLSQEFIPFVPAPQTPLPSTMNTQPQHCAVLNMEMRQANENDSQVSALEMGSIKMNTHYNPYTDPSMVPFVPPMEITIRIKEPIRRRLKQEDLIATSRPTPIYHGRRQPSARIQRAELLRHKSCPSQTECREASLEKVQSSSTHGSEGQSSYYTSPTADILSDGSAQTIMLGHCRKGLVRREIFHIIGKVRFLKRKERRRPRSPFRMQSTNGCLA
eukprot:scaffold6052_cov118-Cylindrotheca_fusiformis.AAC.3